ncbi:MAG: GntR family transcriptional regulator [Burkholderiaceae bacterium]|jgi:DNA-binding GntR family transcriptional regulator|nr:GntR family transcriptional regulator [Burkholderiaceae bacterium]
MTNIIKLDRYRQAAPQLYDLLREQIISVELKPGDSLSRNEIANRFGVSQTPVRDALMRLEQENLVEIFPQSGTRVSKIDLHAAQQAHFLRKSVETELVYEFAIQKNESVITALDIALERLKSLANQGHIDPFIRADKDFHYVLYEEADLLEIWSLLQIQSGHIDRIRRLHLPAAGKRQKVIDDHQKIVDAIRTGDGVHAQRTVREHLAGTLSNISLIQEKYPDFF